MQYDADNYPVIGWRTDFGNHHDCLYVSELPGHGGVDWGYTPNFDKALPLSRYWHRRFMANARRCGQSTHHLTLLD